ncbi:MAG TPA: S41 family peptidase [Anaeromyxobacter sp.]|nr:S41 family peptidase [Anaeromyxobacter sp.]
MRRTLALLVLPLALAGCPREDSCSVRDQKAAVSDLMGTWYLYPDLLVPVNPGDPAYATVTDYLDALTADARAQGLDRYWTYATTVTATRQFFDEGTSVGFGIGLLVREDAPPEKRLFVSQVYAGSAAFDAGFLRGDEILAIGESETTLVDVATLLAGDALGSALGPSAAGVSRTFRVLPRGAIDPVLRSPTKRTYSLDPVPAGWTVIDRTAQGLPPAGYVALRAFIDPADPLLEEVFAQFRLAGVRDVVVDLRYNGGGRLATAALLSDLLGGARSTTDVMFEIQYRSTARAPDTIPFSPAPQSIAPFRVAFVTTEGSASASELVPNVLEAHEHGNVGLVGQRTHGKPVGQIPFELNGCDLVIAVVAFRLVNAEGDGAYYDGLPDAAGKFTGAFCGAPDDLTRETWDPLEESTKAALEWLATGACPQPQVAAAKPAPTAAKLAATPDRYPASPAPDEAQRHVRGLF